MADKENTSSSKPKSFLSQINKQATLRGSVNSTINSTMRGASVISNASSQFKKETQQVLQPGRVETFSQAMERLQIDSNNLALIHNQILLQVYLTFFLSFASFVIFIQFIFRGMWVPGVLSLIISLTCFVNFAQSSIRTYQVRHKKLGAASDWLGSFSEWIPKRMTNLVPMDKSDPLRHPVLLNSFVSKAKFYMFLGFAFFGCAVGIHLASFGSVPPALLGALYLFSVSFVIYGGRFSFEVFRRSKGVQSDLLYWLISPGSWIPTKKEMPIKSTSPSEVFNGS